METKECVVVLSGGQDSATCLLWALCQHPARCVLAVSFDYGQRHRVELECAQALCRRLGVEQLVVRLPLAELTPGNALTDSSVEVRAEGSRLAANLPTTFVPGRNLLMLTAAASAALARGASEVVTGVCETDFSGYPDCRANTLAALELALRLGTEQPVRLVAPLMHKSKAEIWQLAADLHPDGELLIRDLTHTCYKGDHQNLHLWGYGCNNCPACQLRSEGWRKYRSNYDMTCEG